MAGLSGTSTTFPRRVAEILANENSDVIGWNPDGKSFRINDPLAFCGDILPRYFRHCKLTSFQRQLNLYGFQKVHVGPLGGAYFHPLFQRDNVALMDQMKRTVRKGGATEEFDFFLPTNGVPPMPWSLPVGFSESFGLGSVNSSSSAAATAASAAAAAAAAAVFGAPHSYSAAMPHPIDAHSLPMFLPQPAPLSTPLFPMPRPQQPSEAVALRAIPEVRRKERHSSNTSVGSMDSQEWMKEAHSILRESGGFLEDPAACFDVEPPGSDVLTTQGEALSPTPSQAPPGQSVSQRRGGAAMANGRSVAPTPLGKHPRISDPETMSPALVAAAWAISSESMPPDRIEQVLREVPRDALKTELYGDAADRLMSSMGAREALTLTLALLARSHSPEVSGGGGPAMRSALARSTDRTTDRFDGMTIGTRI
jgi:hypothetical protein